MAQHNPPSKAFAHSAFILAIVLICFWFFPVALGVAVTVMSLGLGICMLVMPLIGWIILSVGTLYGSRLLIKGSWNGLYWYIVGLLPLVMLNSATWPALLAICPLSPGTY